MLLVAGAACGARPARFADAPALTRAGDDAPIAVPRLTDAPASRELFDAHLRRSVLDSLEPLRVPEAGDINALDEVPASSWLAREGTAASVGPPVLPLIPLSEPPVSGLAGLAAVDARGVRWELRRDPPGSPVLFTASEVISARLFAALGYRAAEVHAMELAPADLPAAPGWEAQAPVRISATRWPPGIDLGPTPLSDLRADDANDRVPHRDRRTLRALRDVFAWLEAGQLDARVLRDVYVGPPGRGHVAHYVLGLGNAIGAGDAALGGWGAGRDAEAHRRYRSVAVELLAFGLLTPPEPVALGALEEKVTPRDYQLEPPWEPLQRALPGDSFWIAKRMLAIPRERLSAIIEEAGMTDGAARARLTAVLDARRRGVAARAFDVVTPCSLVGVEEPATLVLRDEAIAAGLAAAPVRRYAVEVLDAEGTPLGPGRVLKPSGALLRVEMPAAVATEWRDRAIVRITTERAGLRSPAPLELHLAFTRGVARVIGLRH